MQQWSKYFVHLEGRLFSAADGSEVGSLVEGRWQVSSKISVNFEKSSSKVAMTYRRDKIIYEMIHGVEVLATTIVHIDGDNQNDHPDNLMVPMVEASDNVDLKHFVKGAGLHYSHEYGCTVKEVNAGPFNRDTALLVSHYLGHKCVVKGHPRVELKDVNWLVSGKAIPRGFRVANKDGDFRRNDLDNLCLAPLGIPQEQPQGLHKHWFVKDGLLYNRGSFNVVRTTSGRVWVDYFEENPLRVYSCVAASLDVPYAPSMRAIFPFQPNYTLIGGSLVSKAEMILHLLTERPITGSAAIGLDYYRYRAEQRFNKWMTLKE